MTEPEKPTEAKNRAGAGREPLAKLPPPEHSAIRHVLAVMSGKGGVGKSTVSALLAAALARSGRLVGVLDADVTGPSIPKLLGVTGRPENIGLGLLPPESASGIRVMSLNLLLDRADDPVIWRGPLVSGAVKQFWTDVIWGDLDYLVVDLPPGTGDSPLTVLQSLPVDGIIIVSSPQDLAAMVVRKAVKMARMLRVPILGLVENMTFVRCPRCGEEIHVFGPSRAGEICRDMGIRLLGSLPLDPALSALGDRGEIEHYKTTLFDNIPDLLAGLGSPEAGAGNGGRRHGPGRDGPEEDPRS